MVRVKRISWKLLWERTFSIVCAKLFWQWALAHVRSAGLRCNDPTWIVSRLFVRRTRVQGSHGNQRSPLCVRGCHGSKQRLLRPRGCHSNRYSPLRVQRRYGGLPLTVHHLTLLQQHAVEYPRHVCGYYGLSWTQQLAAFPVVTASTE